MDSDSLPPDVLRNGQFDGTRFSGAVHLEQNFTESEFSSCRFENCILAGCQFEDCSFTECVFDHCDLSLVQVTDSGFQEVNFSACKMVGIDWTRARPSTTGLGNAIKLSKCVLSYSSFFGLDLSNLEILDCIAQEVDFGEANLRGANQRGTDLTSSTFLHTNISNADLRGARNYAIDPRSNTVTNAKFSLPEAVSLLRGLDIIVE